MKAQLDLDDVAATSDLAQREIARLMAQNEDMRKKLSAIAAIAHTGGLANTSEDRLWQAIRRFTLSYWDATGSMKDLTKRVLEAIQGKTT